MKKIVIYTLMLFFAFLLGCKKDLLIDPGISDKVFVKVPDTTLNAQPDTQIKLPIEGNDLYEFQDFDGNIYHAVQIGNQVWSKENLLTTHYNDGTPIPLVKSTNKWSTLTTGAYCHYNNAVSNSETYGLLYNYYAVYSNKLAPKGWHVATYDDWNTLLIETGNKPFPIIGDVGLLVDQSNWSGPFYSINNKIVECTNSTHFTALPNGYRDNSISDDYPEFDCQGFQASWWASNNNVGVIIYLDQTFGIFPREDRRSFVGSGIRLVKDAD